MKVCIKPCRESDPCHRCDSYKGLRKKLITLESLLEDYYNVHDEHAVVVIELNGKSVVAEEELEAADDDQLSTQIKRVSIENLKLLH